MTESHKESKQPDSSNRLCVVMMSSAMVKGEVKFKDWAFNPRGVKRQVITV